MTDTTEDTGIQLVDRARDYTESVEWMRAMVFNVDRLRGELAEAKAKLAAAKDDVALTHAALVKAIEGES
jgi:hypothetical protein